MNVGQRIELTCDIESLGVRARRGDKGVVRGVHTGGHLTVRMDNGRTQFPCTSEVKAMSN